MARRVSLKGKGVDLFFGDHPPGVDGTPSDDETEATAPAPPSSSREQTAADTEQARPSANGVADDRDLTTTAEPGATADDHAVPLPGAETPSPSVPEPPAVAAEPDFVDVMWERLVSQASNSNSFRYTAPELDELNDALYHVSKAEHVRLTKQDIARLGLNAVLWDYRRRGDASWLSEFARRKRQPKER